MKKNLLFLLMAVFALSFTACSDDDDNKSLAEELAGTYTGTIDIYSVNESGEQGSQIGETLENQNIYTAAMGENGLQLELKNFKFAVLTIASIKVDSKVSTDGKNTITGQADNIKVMEGITATAIVSGSIVNSVADLNINVEAPLQPNQPAIKMLVKFKGSKK